MELTQLRYFLEVAKTEHVTKSAEHLHIAQPALTQAIRRLESELEVPLFQSKGRNIALTEYGYCLKEKLEPLLKELDTLTTALQGLREKEERTVRIELLAASELVTNAVIAYKREHPEVIFRVMQQKGREEADIRVSTRLSGGDERRSEEIEGEETYRCTEELFLAVPETGEWTQKKDIQLADVKEASFLSLAGSKQLRSICDHFCGEAGFVAQIIFESDSPVAVKNMIAANLGIGFWPKVSWGEVDREHVRLLHVTNPVCKRDIVVSKRIYRGNNAHIDQFYCFLKEWMEEKARNK